MTQSKKPDFESTINIDTTDSMGTITITGTNDMDSSMDSYVYTIDDGNIDISNIVYNDNITFDWDNISITPTLWTEVLPNVDTVNDMCKEYPALAKAYENFQTVYKLVEQDYKGKKEDLDL